MHPVAKAEIEAVRPALEALCARYNVERLWVFGSATGREFDPARSDLDFLAQFGAVPKESNAFGQLVHFILAIEGLFTRSIHLTPWGEGSGRNPYFRESVERTRKEIYAG